MAKCPECDGKGYIWKDAATGETVKDGCLRCHGNGTPCEICAPYL